MGEDTETGGPARGFPSTSWSLILGAREGPEARRAALEALLGLYWKPLYLRVRRRGLDAESAQDAVQDFSAHIIEGDLLARADPAKGRFRSYLRMALDHFLSNISERERAQKRGGDRRRVSLDAEAVERELARAPADADAAYDREWALGVMERAAAALGREFQEGRRRGPLALALRFSGLGEPPSHAEAAAESGLSPAQWKAFLHRTRARFREIVRGEVAATLDEDGDLDAEIDALVRALA